MKVLIISDLHLYPLNRKDNIYETVKDKFRQIYQLIKEYKIDEIWILGDIFNVYNPPLIWIYNFISLISKIKKPIKVLFGNHDFKGDKKNSAVGILIKAGVLQKLETFQYKNKMIRVFDYETDLEKLKNQIKIKDFKNFINILLIHNAVLRSEGEAPFEGLYVDELKNLGYNFIISGHYHNPFMHESEKTVFINLGSFLRIKKNEQHIPRCLILDLDNLENFEIKEFQVLNLEEIFRLEKIKDRSQEKDLVVDLSFSMINIEEELKTFIKENFKNFEKNKHIILKYL